MAKIEYHLLAPEALPLRFWQTAGEDQETILLLNTLQQSMLTYGACWMVWDGENRDFYETRDLYRCSIVEVIEHDVLDRAIPFGDLRRRESLQLFFSAKQFQKILSTELPRQQLISPCDQARAFTTSISGASSDVSGAPPVGSIEISVPFAMFREIANRTRRGAARHGKRVVTLHPCLLFLKAALLVLEQQIQYEYDPLRRQEFVDQRERLRQMRTIRSQWLHDAQYITIEQHAESDYVVRVGIHPSIYQDAA